MICLLTATYFLRYMCIACMIIVIHLVDLNTAIGCYILYSLNRAPHATETMYRALQ